MNYRHHYHAGNFADVVKHLALVDILRKLKEKEKPFCVIDTHAGIGLYDLEGDPSQKTGEYLEGIAKLAALEKVPEGMGTYLNIVKSFNAPRPGGGDALYRYPGSPEMIRSLLREKDRLFLSELHPEDFKKLKARFVRDHRVHAYAQDGYTSLKAFLPPLERRGLVLIDPPFEKKDEWAMLKAGLKDALKRFQNGTYLVWFPIKAAKTVRAFYHSLLDLAVEEILLIEYLLRPPKEDSLLNGCGLIVLNPPWQFEEKMEKYLTFLQKVLGHARDGKVNVVKLKAPR